MATQLINAEIRWCDLCLVNSVYTRASPLHMGWAWDVGGEEAWRGIDTCAADREAVEDMPFRDVLKLFREAGVLLDGSREEAEAEEAETEASEEPEADTKSELARLAEAERGLSEAETDANRSPCQWCIARMRPRSFEVHLKTAHGFAVPSEAWGNVCPLCGGHREYKSLGAHTVQRHRLSVAEVFDLADSMGDPHRIVEQRRKVKGSLIPKESAPV